MSITPKIDEIRSVLSDLKTDIAAFTETWLKDSIQNTVIDIPGYRIYRNTNLSLAQCVFGRPTV